MQKKLSSNFKKNCNYIKKLYINKVLLVVGKKSFYKNKYFIFFLNNYDHKIVRINSFFPKENIIKNKKKNIYSKKIDTIVAIGGGNIIDHAKLIKKFYFSKKTIIIAIPTTAGSGSEATSFAVMYKDNFTKTSIKNNYLMPNISILDGQNLLNLNLNQKKFSFGDALCQAIESYWSKKSSVISKKLALSSMNILFSNSKKYLKKKISMPLANKVLSGANLAGKAINLTNTTAPHAYSYFLTSKFNFPHGLAVTILMFFFLNINLKNMKKNNLIKIFKIFKVKDISELQNKWLNIFNYDIKKILKKYKFSKKEYINQMLTRVNLERLKNNPVKIDKKKFYEVFLNYI
jgi:alcohol dehydrogenase class IV